MKMGRFVMKGGFDVIEIEETSTLLIQIKCYDSNFKFNFKNSLEHEV